MRKACSNPDPKADHPRPYRGWGKPDMVRLYIRESHQATLDDEGERIPYHERKTKRSWTPVGMICPGCRWVELDDLVSEEETG